MSDLSEVLLMMIGVLFFLNFISFGFYTLYSLGSNFNYGALEISIISFLFLILIGMLFEKYDD